MECKRSMVKWNELPLIIPKVLSKDGDTSDWLEQLKATINEKCPKLIRKKGIIFH